MKKKVGFLYFEDIHHIPHFIGIASELSKYKDVTVEILTFKNSHDYLFKLIQLLGCKNIIVRQLDTPFIRRIIDKISGRKKPSPVFLYKKHKKLLLNFDALVFTEKNHKCIHKHRKEKKTPFLVSINHGTAGRGYAIQPAIKLFDLLLLGGEFYVERLMQSKLIANKHAIIGYSKFDVVKKEIESIKGDLFYNNKPVVVYNPHFNKINSSWYNFGNQILEFFYQSEDYNLIFAPHIYLFNRKRFLTANIIDEKYYCKDNILIDLGSINSSNMMYTLNSDIYLGDVSSQINEFHIHPRPCVFINSLNIDWEKDINYKFWTSGTVISTIDELGNALKVKNEAHFKIQKELFDENYHTDEKNTASERGAFSIHNFLKNSDS